MSNIMTTGSCHCGCIFFEVQIPKEIRVQSCNCSICSMVGFLHLIVPAGQFRLLRGRDDLTEYRFNSGSARHLFCSNCGIKSFYVPRSNPDGFSINLRCLRVPPEVKVIEEHFDGRNWEQNADTLRHFSRIDS
jgi:hypothetical protein